MIKQAVAEDAQQAAQLALLLWPNHTLSAFIEEMTQLITAHNATILLAYEGAEAIGFAQCQLRTDYVEGTSSSPVGYLEGLFVQEPYRKRGIAQQLVSACEHWAKQQGCTEFASDCEWQNAESIAVHKKLGFQEANRIVCFTKKL
ncbi:aminoglycoside 6'-N-acetyltransferase [Lysinibacillus piscis]|uniref:Aminoglycoside N(6')-acetyltransferase type 1 n=1 Tax=Lysinibacillus piscis TaxID=2518931 RepID=A0ABQ5NLD8_9BACI|nr:aminoglycoside 6'-N-acetyltransferase [Lysinibacillus sp. KH24]GLC88911.1 N-acetyltransferase [Lysinibacillus sp. KH24]